MSFWKTFVKKSNTSSDRDDLLESIHYQLTTLLNSEAPMRLIPSVYSETQKSIYCFGLDNSQSQSSQIEKDQFSRALERLIQSFETAIIGSERVRSRGRSNQERDLFFHHG